MKKLLLKHIKNPLPPTRWKIGHQAQATTELAIMGSIVIMILAYLLQQGYIYNCRQALEMYAFRQALQLSRSKEKGITLTVIRDVISPSFFSGLNRQRLMATSSVEYNPYKLHIPYQEDPEDLPGLQLIQVGEAMIRKGAFFQVPPTMIKVSTKDSQKDAEWNWVNSAISEIDPQTQDVKLTQRTSSYKYETKITDNAITKSLESVDKIPTGIIFEDADSIKDNYYKGDYKGEITGIDINQSTIPGNAILSLEETIKRTKNARN